MSRRRHEKKKEDESFERRDATLYDAVAGRIKYEGFLRGPKQAAGRLTNYTTSVPIFPEEVLYAEEHAPIRYWETDNYFADSRLSETKKQPTEQQKRLKELQQLPESDLLKALHVYVSEFYSSTSEDRGRDDWESLDETALLAMGILIEEAAKQIWKENEEMRNYEQPVETDTLDQMIMNGEVRPQAGTNGGVAIKVEEDATIEVEDDGEVSIKEEEEEEEEDGVSLSEMSKLGVDIKAESGSDVDIKIDTDPDVDVKSESGSDEDIKIEDIESLPEQDAKVEGTEAGPEQDVKNEASEPGQNQNIEVEDSKSELTLDQIPERYPTPSWTTVNDPNAPASSGPPNDIEQSEQDHQWQDANALRPRQPKFESP